MNIEISSATDQGDCTICFESFYGNTELTVTKCTHIFHKSCIEKWSEQSPSCPACRNPLSVLLETKVDSFLELFRVVTNHYTRQLANKEMQLAERESQIGILQKKINDKQKELDAVSEALSMPLGDRLDQLSEKQLKMLADEMTKESRLYGNLQTFVRQLFSEKNSHGEEANKLWEYFRNMKDDKDIIHKILTTYSQRYHIGIDQLKKVSRYCGIYRIDDIVDKVNKIK
jgi:hypothetical protein